AGAIGTHDPRDLSGGEGCGDILERPPAAIARADVLEGERRAHDSLRKRRISQKKNGAPMSAVTTPSRSCSPGSMRRTSTSEAVPRPAPPGADGRISCAGLYPVNGRSRCGTTRPTKLIAPAAAVAAPVASATPVTTRARTEATLTPRLSAASSP